MNAQETMISFPCMASKDGRSKEGVYTGFEYSTNSYYVSFYDGSVGRYSSLADIHFSKDSDREQAMQGRLDQINKLS